MAARPPSDNARRVFVDYVRGHMDRHRSKPERVRSARTGLGLRKGCLWPRSEGTICRLVFLVRRGRGAVVSTQVPGRGFSLIVDRSRRRFARWKRSRERSNPICMANGTTARFTSRTCNASDRELDVFKKQLIASCTKSADPLPDVGSTPMLRNPSAQRQARRRFNQ